MLISVMYKCMHIVHFLNGYSFFNNNNNFSSSILCFCVIIANNKHMNWLVVLLLQLDLNELISSSSVHMGVVFGVDEKKKKQKQNLQNQLLLFHTMSIFVTCILFVMNSYA